MSVKSLIPLIGNNLEKKNPVRNNIINQNKNTNNYDFGIGQFLKNTETPEYLAFIINAKNKGKRVERLFDKLATMLISEQNDNNNNNNNNNNINKSKTYSLKKTF